MTNEKHKAEWVAALRSGEYEQTRGVLRKGDAFCCLGVAGDLAGCEQIQSWRDDISYQFDGSYVASFPLRARQWLEVMGSSVFLPNGDVVWLDQLNDDGFTFDQIADVIENGELA